MASVQEHVEGRPFCIVTYHTDEDNGLCSLMVDSMIGLCQNVCDDLELDYLEQYNEGIHELTMYVQDRQEGIQLIEALMQSHIWPHPTDEYRAFWASIFEECGGKWSNGNNADRAFVQAARVMYEWMEEDEWMEQELEYDGDNYDEVLNSVKYAVESILFSVGERVEENKKHDHFTIPEEVVMADNILFMSDSDRLQICTMLAIELLQERGIIG